MDTLRSTTKLLKLPSGGSLTELGYEWHHDGGFAGAKVIDRAVKRATELGWKQTTSQNVSPSGSTVNDEGVLLSPDGSFRLKTSVSWGVTKDSNYFSIRLSKVEPKTESVDRQAAKARRSARHLSQDEREYRGLPRVKGNKQKASRAERRAGKADVRSASNESLVREMVSMKDGGSEQSIMSALRQGGGSASFIADTVDQASMQKAMARGVQSKTMGNEVVAWLPGKEPPKTRLGEARGMVGDYSAEEIEGMATDMEGFLRVIERIVQTMKPAPPMKYDDAMNGLHRIMGTLRAMGASSITRGKTEVKLSDIRKVVREELQVEANQLDDAQLDDVMRAIVDDVRRRGQEPSRDEVLDRFDEWSIGMDFEYDEGAAHLAAGRALARREFTEGVACRVCGEEHPPHWEDDDDAELSVDGEERQCAYNQPKPLGWVYGLQGGPMS